VTLLVGRQQGHLACKKLGVHLWVVTIWSFARLIAPVVTNTIVILSSSKIQIGDVLVPANPHQTGKWPLKWRERLHKKIQELVLGHSRILFQCFHEPFRRSSGLLVMTLK